MAKRSHRSISKKFFPKELKRITEEGKRVWALFDMRFQSLNEFLQVSRMANLKRLIDAEKLKEEQAKLSEQSEPVASGLGQVV